MNTDNTVEYNSLSWVKAQLDDVLSDAQASLNEYIENQTDGELENCIEHLQLVYGTLQMVEVFGASTLAEEMQLTTVALLEGNVDRAEDTYDVLMRGMLQLPDYLEGIQAGKKDAPVTLMALINDLRAARKEGLLTESALFSPDIESAILNSDAYDVADIEPGKLRGEIKRLRAHYQLGLLDFLGNKKQRVGLQRIKAVLKALEKISSDDEVRHMWMVVNALAEGLMRQGIDTNLSIKMLLGAVDRQLKFILDNDEDVFSQKYSKEIVKNILYYVGLCTVETESIDAVKQAYHLNDLMPQASDDSAAISGLNADLFDTVSKGITEDLFQVKETLELFMYSDERDIGQLVPVVGQLGRIADTYGMLGLDSAKQSIIEQRNIMDGIAKGDIEINDQVILGVAAELLNAESELKDYIDSRLGFVDMRRRDDDGKNSTVPAAEYRDVVHTVVAEALRNFAEAKEGILSYVSGIGDKKQLDVILKQIDEVRGVSMMLPIGQVESQIEILQDYIRVALLNNNHKADEDEQDTVADVVTSIEYFFEALSEGRPGVERGLKTGNQAAKKLETIVQSYGGLNEDSDVDEKEATANDDEIENIAALSDAVSGDDAQSSTAEPKKKITEGDITQYQILSEDADDEIIEIFIEEAIEVLGRLHEYLSRWKADTDDEEALAVVRRSFHTLKGSGRLLGAEMIGEFSWRFENMLNRVIDKKIMASDDMFRVLDESLTVLPQLIEQLKGNREPIENIAHLMLSADALAEGHGIPSDPTEVPGSDDAEDENIFDLSSLGLDEDSLDGVAEEIEILDLEGELLDDLDSESETDELATANFSEIEIDGIVDDEEEVIDLSEVDEYEIVIEEEGGDDVSESVLDIDPVLLKIYHDESKGHVENVKQLIAESEDSYQPLKADKDLIRAFHTLYGSARTAGVEPIADLSGAAEKFVKIRQENGEEDIPEDVVGVFKEIEQAISGMLSKVSDGHLPVGDKILHDKINKIVQQEIQFQLQHSWQDNPSEEGAKKDKEDDASHLEATHGDNKKQPIEEIAEQSMPMSYGDIDDELIDIFLEEAEELLEQCENTLSEIKEAPNAAEHIHQLQRNMHTLKGGARMADLSPVGDLTHKLESLVVLVSENKIEVNEKLFDLLQESFDALTNMLGNVKKRLPLTSANNLSNRIDMLMRGEVQEKRLIERFDIELSELEFNDDERLEDIDISQLLPDNDEINNNEEPEEVDMSSLFLDDHELDDDEDNTTADFIGDETDQVNDEQKESKDGRPHWGERASDVNYKESQEQVRVRADLLNNLVNYAGEVNIYHARMGKQITDFGFNLSELTQTVVRLKEQLRNLEIETEIQIRSGYEKESDNYDADFDPLEMDQYSTLQQLTRSLSETASDVDSINKMLSEITRDSETLLVQESRISTDLQEGLMRTRMVRFGGLSSRLRRIVRQIARELGKEVEVEIIGENSEVDRTVLDRIIAPLEHLLRNAVAHGIEKPEERKTQGKNETGKITVNVDRKGADVVINIKDDGAGIDIEKVRETAIKQGLITEGSNLSNHDTLQFILQSGFSTADEVTQVSGRGVGMDVVDSEIKQLGGVLDIDTVQGKGTDFNIRLPLTLAINQALLIAAGDNVFAVPLASIEGVVRMTGYELQQFYDSGNNHYEFNDISFELKHLGGLLTGVQPDYSKQLQLFPVLLVRVGDKHFALHVDDMLGRREIVVKPVGLQIGAVRGIAGATILEDGRVVIILEMSALVAAENLFKTHAPIDEDEEQQATIEPVAEQPRISDKKTIMVVDDSITIRKITERMLKRYGIEVVLAKDGVDASNQLQNHMPDLMLLDIEMPYMDGFEVATFVRSDERLKNLPIIMITSRTGSKHKEKAMEIGVNKYLGKPFQEDDLMKNINKILHTTF